MHANDLFSLIIPDDGVICISDTTEGYWRSDFVKTLPTFKNSSKKELRISMCSFSGNRRKADLALSAKALLIDIDFGHKSGIKDLDALYPLWQSMIGKIPLHGILPPSPVILKTGNGVHLLFPLGCNVPAQQWKVINRALAAMFEANGIAVDKQASGTCTVSTRVPGSINKKNNAVVVVEPNDYRITTPSDWEILLSDFILEEERKEKHNSDFPANKHAPSIISGCRQVREAGAQSEPVWHRAITVLERTTTYDEAVHEISRGHDTYSEESTDIKIEYVRGLNKPATCHEFAYQRAGVCHGCPNYGKIQSPVQLGMKTIIPIEPIKMVQEKPEVSDRMTTYSFPTSSQVEIHNEVVLSDTQTNVYQTEEGIFVKVYRQPRKDEGDEPVLDRIEKITSTRIFPQAVVYDSSELGGNYFIHWGFTGMKSNKGFVSKTSTLTDTKSTALMLAACGIVVKKDVHFKAVSEFLRGLAIEAMNTFPVVPRSKHMGWNGDKFYVGTRYYSKDGVGYIPPQDDMEEYAKRFTINGDLKGWRRAAEVFERDVELNPSSNVGWRAVMTIVTAFAAPLMQFSGVNGFVLHLHGDSGAGKSTLQTVLLSVWGDPEALLVRGLGAKTGDTQNSFMRTTAVYNSLPVCGDEITNAEEGWASDFVYNFSMGTERNRLKANRDALTGGTWRTVAVTSANTKLSTMVGQTKNDSTPEQMRMWEFNDMAIEKKPNWSQDREDIRTGTSNHGAAGNIYAQWLVANQKEVQDDILKTMRTFGAVVNARQNERIWLASIACYIIAARLAVDAGILKINMAQFQEWLAQEWERQRLRTTYACSELTKSAPEMLGKLLADYNGMYNVVEKSKPSDNTAFMNVVKSSVARELVGVVILESNTCVFSRAAIENWLRKNGMDDYNQFVNTLKLEYGENVIVGKANLTTGCYQTPAMVVSCVVVKNAPIGVIDANVEVEREDDIIDL